MYVRAIVTFRGAGKARRWRSAIAVVVALGLFAAVTMGWAARASSLAGTASPQPAGLSQVAPHAGEHTRPMGHVAQGFSSGSPHRHQKPTTNAWMTPDRPPTWNRLSAQSVSSPLPASFAASGFRPGLARSDAPAAVHADRDVLTQLCISRR